MTYLAIENVVKTYDGKVRAVDGISLAIKKGEFVTFLGPSGSGKTTTLMMIAGFERPDGGGITLAGRPIDPVPPHRRNIGMVFQSYALFPNMSVERNVGFPLRMRRVPKDRTRAKVAEILDVVGLSAFARAEPRTLSGGQQQRVALARALVFGPDVLLLDEPLGALDKNLREQMQIEIRRIHRDLGVTTVYVTHDQTEAMTMSDRIVVFNAGRIEQIDAPLEIYHRPKTRFVAEFVGDNNVMPATAHDGDGVFEVAGLGPVKTQARGVAAGPAWLAVRPESIRATDADDRAENKFQFAVQGMVNYGDSAILFGTINGKPLKIRMPASASLAFHDGMSLAIGWDAAQVHVIAPQD